MKTIITYGTFDVFHIGHVNLLRRLRALGSRLVVGCSTDEFNVIKGKQSLISFEHRVSILEACRYVDSVFPEHDWNQKRQDIIRQKADIFAIGDDWAGKFDDLSDICEVIYLPRTKNISSTEIRQMIKSIRQEELAAVKLAADQLINLINRL